MLDDVMVIVNVFWLCLVPRIGHASFASLLGLSAQLNPVARLVAAKALFWGAPGAGRGRVDAPVEKHMACGGPSICVCCLV